MTKSYHELLLETDSLLHVSTTGAGGRLLTRLLDTPGSSPYIVGGFIPYSRTQQHSFLGHEPEGSYTSAEVAYDMAMASFIRAAEHKTAENLSGKPIGLGITATVASLRPHRGEQRCHMVLITEGTVNHLYLEFKKGVGEALRKQQDSEIETAALTLLSGVLSGSTLTSKQCETEARSRFYHYPIFYTNGTRKAPQPTTKRIYLPATLNPIHEGHRAMCRAAEEALSPEVGQVRVSYLVSSTSPHKGDMSVQQMLMVAGMLRAERWVDGARSRSVEFTHSEPLFLDKAIARPGSIFLIGADTMQRMLDPKWGADIKPMLTRMLQLDVKFYVMGREVDGRWLACRDIPVPWPAQALFRPLTGRVDISSTTIREATNG